MVNDSLAALAVVGIGLYYGPEDEEGAIRAIGELACRRCGQILCDGYPCFDYEEAELVDVYRIEAGSDAESEEAYAALAEDGCLDVSLLVFGRTEPVDDLEFFWSDE